MDIKELQKKAIEIRDLYNQYTEKKGYKQWTYVERMQGFVKDVGELMELIMVKSGFRKGEDIDVKLKHELSDCLWSILVLADELDIDIEESFGKTMDELKERITSKMEE